jgi:hypothetical protein
MYRIMNAAGQCLDIRCNPRLMQTGVDVREQRAVAHAQKRPLVYLVVRGALAALQQATTGGQRYAGEHVLVGRFDDSRCVGLQALLQLAVGTGLPEERGRQLNALFDIGDAQAFLAR